MQDYLPDFRPFFRVNSASTALLYEIIVEEKLPVEKVVVASSQAVYGEGKYVCRGQSAKPESGNGGEGERVRG